MVDPLLGVEIGKSHIEMARNNFEMRQWNIAEMVQMDLEEAGYPCKIIEDGTQRLKGHIGIPTIKVTKLKIIPTKKVDEKKFQILKDQLTQEYIGIEQSKIVEEKRELKRQKREEKNAKKKK